MTWSEEEKGKEPGGEKRLGDDFPEKTEYYYTRPDSHTYS